MIFETIQLQIQKSVAVIRLYRPDHANAVSLRMAMELNTAAERCARDDIRAVMIIGQGEMFSAGGDINEFVSAGREVQAHLTRVTDELHGALTRLAALDAPVIAAVNGTAAGAGFSLAMAADMAIAARSAKFTMAYTRIGLTPDGAATYHVPRIIGWRRAMELFVTNRVLSAEDALDWGLVNWVVEDADLEREALELAHALAEGPTAAFGRVKKLMKASESNDVVTQMAAEGKGIVESAGTDDGREGLSAFLQKRDPVFKGG